MQKSNHPSPSTAVCPECAQQVIFDHAWTMGHLLLCPHCETILAVSSLQPLSFDWAFEEPTDLKNGRLRPLHIYNPHWHFKTDD